jgi:TolB-like protein
MRVIPRLARLTAIGACAAILLLAVGGAGAAARRSAARDTTHRLVGTPGVTLAVLPLEDFSGTAGAGDKLTAVVFSALAGAGVNVIEPGEVDVAFGALRLRSSGALTREQIRDLAVRLGVRYLIAGTVLQYDMIHTPDGDVPALGLALRLIDGINARVRWAGMRAASGEDRETVFGWGRVRNPERLALTTVQGMIHEIPMPAPGDTLAVRPATALRDTTPARDTAAARGGR